jgi:hypothetical protein
MKCSLARGLACWIHMQIVIQLNPTQGNFFIACNFKYGTYYCHYYNNFCY